MLTDLNKYNYGYKTIEEKRQKCPNIFIINPSQTLKRYLHHNIWHHKHTLLSYNTLGFIVLLTIFLVSQEFRIHAFGWHVLGPLLLLDTIGVSLVGIIMRTSVLLLWLYLYFRSKSNERWQFERDTNYDWWLTQRFREIK